MSNTDRCDHDWVDIAEVAKRLGVQVSTVYMMKQRGTLPPARLTVGGHPAWDWNLDWVPWLEASNKALDRSTRRR
jgi:excisionase family DNA binding protein